MEQRAGAFIVIEGTDGSGKGTQFELLKKRLEADGYPVASFDFPRYDLPSSYFVKRYLNGDYGGVDDVGPYTASLFYALDRFEAGPAIRQALAEGNIVLCNRFTGSNMAHQGTKLAHPEERRGYFIWLDNLEHELLRVPRPDISLVLRVPAETAQSLVDKKERRSYTDKKRDLHEADLTHLQRSVAVYDDLTQLFPKDFVRIDCVRSGELLPVETIHELVHQQIQPFLPPAPKKPVNKPAAAEATPEATTAEPPAATNNDVRIVAQTAEAQALLDQTGANPQALARLTGIYAVVPSVSQALLLELLHTRRVTCVTPPSRATAYDQKDAAGNYRYYTPSDLAESLEQQYKKHMDHIFSQYSTMVQALATHLEQASNMPAPKQNDAWHAAILAQARHALEPAVPLAATAPAGLFATAQAYERLVARLVGGLFTEGHALGRQLASHITQQVPWFAERATAATQTQTRRTAARRAVHTMANKHLPASHTSDWPDNVQLTDYWPRNELDLVPDILYDHSDLPLRELRTLTSSWPYDRKADVLEAYVKEPGNALEKAHYSWDLRSSIAAFRDLLAHHAVEDLTWQLPTPRHGYDVPKLVEEAGLSDTFEDCFDTSLKLYSLLQDQDHYADAQYGLLLGHNLRWKVTLNARQAIRLFKRYNHLPLIQTMHEKLAEAHPMLGEGIHLARSNKNN